MKKDLKKNVLTIAVALLANTSLSQADFNLVEDLPYEAKRVGMTHMTPIFTNSSLEEYKENEKAELLDKKLLQINPILEEQDEIDPSAEGLVDGLIRGCKNLFKSKGTTQSIAKISSRKAPTIAVKCENELGEAVAESLKNELLKHNISNTTITALKKNVKHTAGINNSIAEVFLKKKLMEEGLGKSSIELIMNSIKGEVIHKSLEKGLLKQNISTDVISVLKSEVLLKAVDNKSITKDFLKKELINLTKLDEMGIKAVLKEVEPTLLMFAKKESSGSLKFAAGIVGGIGVVGGGAYGLIKNKNNTTHSEEISKKEDISSMTLEELEAMRETFKEKEEVYNLIAKNLEN